VCVCVCVCVREREICAEHVSLHISIGCVFERERQSERGGEREGSVQNMYIYLLCVCVCERERDRDLCRTCISAYIYWVLIDLESTIA